MRKRTASTLYKTAVCNANLIKKILFVFFQGASL